IAANATAAAHDVDFVRHRLNAKYLDAVNRVRGRTIGSIAGYLPHSALTRNPSAGPKISVSVKGNPVSSWNPYGEGSRSRRCSGIRGKGPDFRVSTISNKKISYVVKCNSKRSARRGELADQNQRWAGAGRVDAPDRTERIAWRGDRSASCIKVSRII